MKTKKVFFSPNLLFFSTLCLILIFSSCNKNESHEHLYSCNPVLNQFASDWIANTNYTTREQITQFELDSQRVIFNAISVQNRYELMLDKINSLDSSPDLNASQKSAISEILNFLSINVYDLDSTNDSDFHGSMLTWLTNHESKFTDQEMIHCFYKLDDFHVDYIMDGGGSGGGNSSCNCEDTDDCKYSSTGIVTCNKSANVCNKSSWGCGWFWFSSCSGKCKVPTSNSYVEFVRSF